MPNTYSLPISTTVPGADAFEDVFDLEDEDWSVHFASEEHQRLLTMSKRIIVRRLSYLHLIKNKLWKNAVTLNNNGGGGMPGLKTLLSIITEVASFEIFKATYQIGEGCAVALEFGVGGGHLLLRLALALGNVDIIGIDINKGLRDLFNYDHWPSMIEEVNDLVEKQIGINVHDRQIRCHFTKGLGVYDEYKVALVKGEQWAVDVYNGNKTEDPKTHLIYAKTYLDFADALSIKHDKIMYVWGFIAGVPDATMAELMRLCCCKTSRVKFMSLGDVENRYGKFEYVSKISKKVGHRQCVVQHWATLKVAMAGSGEGKTVCQFIVNPWESIVTQGQMIAMIKDNPNFGYNKYTQTNDGIKIRGSRRLVPFKNIHQNLIHQMIRERPAAQKIVQQDITTLELQFRKKNKKANGATLHNLLDSSVVTETRRLLSKIDATEENFMYVEPSFATINYAKSEGGVKQQFKLPGLKQRVFRVRGDINIEGVTTFFLKSKSPFAKSTLSALRYYYKNGKLGLPSIENTLCMFLYDGEFNFDEMEEIICKANALYFKDRGKFKYESRAVYSSDWNTYVHCNSHGRTAIAWQIMNLINLFSEPYGRFSPRLNKFIRENAPKNIKKKGQTNKHIKESLGELKEKFFDFIKVKFGAVFTARDDTELLSKFVSLLGYGEEEKTLKSFKTAFSQQERWAVGIGQYTADQLAEAANKQSEVELTEKRRRDLLARCRANMSEQAHLKFVKTSDYQTADNDGPNNGARRRRRRRRKEFEFNGVKYTTHDNSTTLKEIKNASRELEVLMSENLLPNIWGSISSYDDTFDYCIIPLVDAFKIKQQEIESSGSKKKLKYGKVADRFEVCWNLEDEIELAALQIDGFPVYKSGPNKTAVIASIKLVMLGAHADMIENQLIIGSIDLSEDDERIEAFYTEVNNQIKKLRAYLLEEKKVTLKTVLSCDGKATAHLYGCSKSGTYFCPDFQFFTKANSPMGLKHSMIYDMWKVWKEGSDDDADWKNLEWEDIERLRENITESITEKEQLEAEKRAETVSKARLKRARSTMEKKGRKSKKRKTKKKRASAKNTFQPVDSINKEMHFTAEELDSFDTLAVEPIIEAITEKKIKELRKARARESKHGVTGEKAFIDEIDSNSLDPLHAYCIVFKQYCKALFLFAKRLEPYPTGGGALGPVCLGFLAELTKFNKSEFAKFVDFLKEEGPKKTRAYENDESPESVAKEPRLSGKASKHIASKPNILLQKLLEVLENVYLADQNMDVVGASTSRTDINGDGACDKTTRLLEKLGQKNRNIFASLIVYVNLITMQMACMTKRFISEKNEVKRKKMLIQNTDHLEKIGVTLCLVCSLLLNGIGSSDYSYQLNCLSATYAKKFERRYNCAPGVFSCQTMERINWYWKNLVAARRKRGLSRPLKTGGVKKLLSLHQQRMLKFYFINIYGESVDPTTPPVTKNDKNNINLDPSKSYMLGFGQTKIDFFDGDHCDFKELTDLQDLIHVTMQCYYKKPPDDNHQDLQKYLGDEEDDVIQFDRKKIEKIWDDLSANCNLYEFRAR